MEKRAVLAAVLMALVFFAGQYFLFPSTPEAPSPTRPDAEQAGKEPAQPAPAKPQPAARPETPRKDEPKQVPTAAPATPRAQGARPPPGPSGHTEPVPMELSTTDLRLGPQQPTGELVLTGEVGGLRVRKTLTFHADTYTIDTTLRLENAGGVARQAALAFPWTTLQEWEGKTAKFLGQHPTTIAVHAGGMTHYTDDLAHPGWEYRCMSTILGPAKNGEQIEKEAAPGDWIALGSSWYTAALIARTTGFEIFTASDPKPADAKVKPATPLRTAIGLRAAPTIPPGAAWEGAFVVFVGPKEYKRLREAHLDDAINFGGFPLPLECHGLPMKYFAVPILALMNWLYAGVHNYGVGVNPVGGCLPMLPQIPIFYALYLAVANSAELQNAPFLCFDFLQPVARALRAMGASWVESLWICNLADIDPLYILPLVMGVTMFVQQKMTPVSGDPAQAKVMLIMPVFFTIMFLNLPSGLVLSWTVSNVLPIAQQWSMNRPKTPAVGAREIRNGSRA